MNTRVISTVFICILFVFIPKCLSLSLYSADDPLHELDSSNFDSIVLQRSHAWIIEFYNNWCGHCIRFAPTWKEFARDIRTWRNIIDVAVVNCADSQNVKLCRDYDVVGFPTIKLFKPFADSSYKGEPLNGDRDVDSMEASIVDFLEAYQIEHDPPDWPDFRPIEVKNVKALTNLIPDDDEPLLLFVEHPNSALGKKVLMDVSFHTTDAFRRVITTNENLLCDLNTKVLNTTLVTVMKVEKDGTEELIAKYSPHVNSTYIRDQMFSLLVGSPRGETSELLSAKTNPHINVTFQESVHMTDLDNALRYLLYQEIGVVKHIYGDRLDALKSFIHTLKNYFPGKSPTMSYLSKLNNWISDQKNITGEKFVQQLDALQSQDVYLPKMKDYVSCKGSEPRYRGYPCSLWTLFHALTVQAYKTDEETGGGLRNEVMQVLPNIKNYIKYFFTCEECVQNFQKLDQNIDREANSSANAVLWLWTAHNRVNERLAGDLTEDPQHPKIQFPPTTMCLTCRLNNGDSDEIKWDEVQVLRFLWHFYGKQNIMSSYSTQYDSKARHHSSYTSGNASMVISLKNVSFYEKWNFQWFTNVDISLCVSLYVVSAVLLVLIFLLFRQRRRRKKSLFKYVNLYP